MKKIAVNLNGGIGRILCAEPALSELSRKPDVDLHVVTSWPEVFNNHPDVINVYPHEEKNLWKKVYKDAQIINPEPYDDLSYCQEEISLIESFKRLILGPTSGSYKSSFHFPSIYLSETEIVRAKKELTDMIVHHGNCSYVIVLQAFGSTAEIVRFDSMLNTPRDDRSKLGLTRNIQIEEVFDPSNRSLNMNQATELLVNLDRRFLVLNFSQIPINLPSVYNVNNSDLRKWFAFIKLSDYFIGIDSIGQHAAAAFGVPGHVFFGATSVANLAYPFYHKVIQREGFPVEYEPYRKDFNTSVNEKAMNFDKETIALVCEDINKKFFS